MRIDRVRVSPSAKEHLFAEDVGAGEEKCLVNLAERVRASTTHVITKGGSAFRLTRLSFEHSGCQNSNRAPTCIKRGRLTCEDKTPKAAGLVKSNPGSAN